MSESTTTTAAATDTAAAATTAATTTAAATTTTAAAPAGRDWLPAEYQADPTFANLGDVAALAKGYKHAAGMVGLDKGQVIRIPKDADAPEWGEIHNRLGRPEKPEGYEIQAPAGVPDTAIAALRQRMHAAGASQKVVAEAMGVYAEVQAAQQAELAARGLTPEVTQKLFAAVVPREQAEAELRQEFGAAYEPRVNAAMKMAKEVAPDMVKLFDEAGIGNHPVVIKGWAALAEKFGEPGALQGGGGGEFGRVLTPAAAEAELNAYQSNPATFKILMDKTHPQHKEVAAKRASLLAMAYPGQAA